MNHSPRTLHNMFRMQIQAALVLLFVFAALCVGGCTPGAGAGETCDASTRESLVRAIRDGDDARTTALLKNPGGNSCVSARLDGGETPLTFAAWFGRRAVLEELIRLGAKINHINEGGETALHYAAIQHHPEIMRLLLAAGADPNRRENVQGYTPLHYAAGFARMDLLRLLLTGEADLVDFDLVDSALVDVDLVDYKGVNALMHALKGGHRQAAAMLLKAGANADAQDAAGESALHCAARREFADSIRLLAATYGARVDVRNRFGETPLMISAKLGDLSSARGLLAAGADPHVTDCGNTYDALKLARIAGHTAMIRTLRRAKNISENDGDYACPVAVDGEH
ncbi:MAG: ankyrin repeat domain-containing protein [bacterium]|nr:ankyrin repeat domain-containing protein [bacterium]